MCKALWAIRESKDDTKRHGSHPLGAYIQVMEERHIYENNYHPNLSIKAYDDNQKAIG